MRIAREEAIDVAVDHLAGGVGVGADLEEERHVPDVVQAERDQQALDEAVDRGGKARIVLRRPVREDVDAGLDGLPDEGQHHAGDDGRHTGDDRHEALAGEEAEIGRQLDAEVAVEQRRRDGADDDSAEHAGVDGRHRLAGQHRHVQEHGHGAERRRHDEVADDGGDGGDAVILGEAEGDADGEDDRQIAKDGIATLGHHLRHDLGQEGEVGRADAEQKAGDGQHGYGQHQRLADLLQHSEG